MLGGGIWRNNKVTGTITTYIQFRTYANFNVLYDLFYINKDATRNEIN